MMKKATLCFLIDKEKVLLAMKKRGFGVGRWNGMGGKVKEGETVQRAASRETEEEIGVKPLAFNKVAKLDFYFPDNKKDYNQTVFVFKIEKWEGKPHETEEMKPKWFKISKLPFKKMWSDDPLWLPKVLAGEKIKASFWFDDKDGVRKYKISTNS